MKNQKLVRFNPLKIGSVFLRMESHQREEAYYEVSIP